MLKHRLKCFEIFQKSKYPKRGPSLKDLDLDDIVYYAKPSKDYEGYANNREEVPKEIKEKFQKLGIPEAEQKYLSGAGGQYDSLNVYHKIKEQRAAK
jgi:Fe-S cluster assembly protein SufB